MSDTDQSGVKGSFSLSRILMVSLLVFALVPAALVAFLLARSNVQALDQLGGKIVGDVAQRVQIDTENHLEQAHTVINGLLPAEPNSEQNEQALTWLAEPKLFEPMAFALTRQTESAAYLLMGTSEGEFFGVEKLDRGVRIGVRGPKDLGRRMYMADAPGDRSRLINTEDTNYEPRTRPWYQRAVEQRKRTFSPIFNSTSKKQLVIVLAQPVYDAKMGVAGVLGVQLYLKRLADMLQSQSISPRGAAYLLDEQGYLVATSAGDTLFTVNVDRLERITPEKSKNAVIRASYAALKDQIFRKTDDAVHRGVKVQRLQQHMESASLGSLIAVQRPFGDELGLYWTLVVAAPEADFTGDLRRALIISLGTMAALVGLAALVAYLIAHRVGRQLRRLGHAAELLGRGEVPEIATTTRFSEVRQLSQVMHDSAGQMQDYRAQLEAHARSLEEANQTLEQRVTERTAQLAASREEALAAARAKAAFLATMSHEIRTPMNGVLGMSALLADTPLNEEQRDWLQTIRVSGDQLLSVINDILDFSKIESGKLELEAEPVGLRGALEQACAIAGLKAADKGLELRVEIAPGVPPAIRGDITRIRQVLINLINNAVKFTEQGSVTVRVAAAVADPASVPVDHASLRFSVQDTGIGIPPERAGALFQAFTQVDASVTRKYGGTGLGLAICKRLVELMGGQIGVDSVQGQGSSFWFTLTAPLAEELAPAQDMGGVAHAPKDLTVLVADDNPVNLKVASAMLKRLGYTVQTANNGREAVDAVTQAVLHGAGSHPLAAVLMDVSMPELDGMQATQLIIAQHGGAAPPVIAMTASILEEEIQGCIDVGMVGSVLKPLLMADLAQALNRWGSGDSNPAIKIVANNDLNTLASGGFDSKNTAGQWPLVDLTRLEEFREFDDAQLSMTHGVLRMHLHDAPLRLDAMEDAIAKSDAAALYKAVHALKGAAGNVGALALEALCVPLEAPAGRGVVPTDSMAQLAALRECSEKTGLELTRLLADWA